MRLVDEMDMEVMRKRTMKEILLPIPLTAGVGLELGLVPPREKFGFES